MGVKEIMELCLFWSERIGFFILALSWSLFQAKTEMKDMRRLLFWKNTTFLYFLLSAGKTLFKFWKEKQIRHPACTKPLRAQLQKSFFVNPGFALELLALLICESCVWIAKYPVCLLEQLVLLHWASLLIVPGPHRIGLTSFVAVNIFFAWIEGPTESQLDLHHRQKELLDGEIITRTAMGESINQQHSESVYRRAERVLFWVERLALSILTIAWLLLSSIKGLLSLDLLLRCRNIINCFWMCTNTLYFLMYVGRLLEEKHTSRLLLMNSFKNHPGFWLERLALLFMSYGVVLYASSSSGARYLVLDSCFTIIFPLLHIYFAWFGYSKEFQNDLLFKVRGPGKHQSEEAKNLMDKKGSSSASSPTNDLRMMLESLEDRIPMKIVNAMEENHKKYLVERQNAWQTALIKVVEKYGEDNQRLKELNNELAIKLSVATASSQLYQSLLHDNISINHQ